VGLLWPYNLAIVILATATWMFFTPSLDRTVHFQLGWIAEIFVRDLILLTIVSGGLHLRLYTTRGQGKKFKYSERWLAKDDPKFLFRDQTWDNIFWNLTSGCFFWTAWEAVTLYLFANKLIPYLDWRLHPVYFLLMFLGFFLIRQVHFYFIHRLIHWKPLYRISHYVHHKNVNIGPWSGLSMNPIEHFIYFSCAILNWVIPSHPIHAVFNLMHAAILPAVGHSGFHRFVGRGERGLPNDNYFHYLHHRFFTVNYGNDAFPLDVWFGSFYDGSPESHSALLARRGGKELTSSSGG
jgi:sterol desaturase/sphingolipid hydroxylase (fatty acid hydroxylase superfamily)